MNILKCYLSDELVWRFFKAMGTKVIVLPKHDLNYKLKLVSNEDYEKKIWIFP